MSRPFYLGGQAVVEGVMMRSPHHMAVAVRRESGDIVVRREPVRSLLARHRWLNKPFLRGVFALFEALVLGMRALNFSAEIAMADDRTRQCTAISNVNPANPSTKQSDNCAAKSSSGIASGAITVTMVVAFLLGLFLFVVLPNYIVDLIRPLQNQPFVQNLTEGLMRLVIFFLYVVAIGFNKDIRRVFQYHGAEHKVVWTVENTKPLTIEAARTFPISHPRCGTTFVFLVLVLSIFVFAFLGWNENLVVRVVSRIALLPVIAGISYELIRLMASRPCVVWTRILLSPGLALQCLTTREPTDDQIEVAIKAMEAVVNLDEEPEPARVRSVQPEPVPAG